jgi:hypothetical protein
MFLLHPRSLESITMRPWKRCSLLRSNIRRAIVPGFPSATWAYLEINPHRLAVRQLKADGAVSRGILKRKGYTDVLSLAPHRDRWISIHYILSVPHFFTVHLSWHLAIFTCCTVTTFICWIAIRCLDERNRSWPHFRIICQVLGCFCSASALYVSYQHSYASYNRRSMSRWYTCLPGQDR